MIDGLRSVLTGVAALGVGVAALVACGANPPEGFHPDPPGGGIDAGTVASADAGATSPPGPPPPTLGLGNDAGPGDAGPPPPPAAPVAIVYAHSADTLYKLDPTTHAVSVVGKFTGCTQVIDLALDQSSNAYVTTQTSFCKLDLATAKCTHIADGSYPNSLSFVPKGTLDPNVEALVGYVGSEYVRIDPPSGAVSNVGNLSGGYQSSGDIVSVIGGGTFLTVTGNGCSDCLIQVDPKTGDVVQNYGDVSHGDVYGLAFWGGSAYGFDSAGEVFSIVAADGGIATQVIPVPNPPANLSFWGAGSTTSAPPTAADGGGIPILPPK
ncbi:MAG TPA: hypothetical protein VGI39_24265 [Polyangiaceae bacterium]